MNLKTIGKFVGLGVALAILALAAVNSELSGVSIYANNRLAFSPVLTLVNEAMAQQSGGKLRVAVPYDPRILDPHYIYPEDIVEATILTHIVETLLETNQNGNLRPLLAESWEYSEDGRTLTLHLRKGINFHDGTPFNAEAVRFNLETRIRNPECATALLARPELTAIRRVNIIDEYTIAIDTETVVAPLLWILAQPSLGIISPKRVTEAIDKGVKPCGMGLEGKPVGTGPFVFKERIWETYTVLERNKDYWGKKSYLDEIIFVPMKEDSVRIAALAKGDVHVAMSLPPDAGGRKIVTPSVRTIYIGMNMNFGPLKNQSVREAINYGVDKEEIVNKVLRGSGLVSNAPVAQVLGRLEGPYSYNPVKAKELLVTAGFDKGFEVELLVWTGLSYYGKEVAEAVGAMLNLFNIKVKVILLEDFATFLSYLRKDKHQMFLFVSNAWTMEAFEPLFNNFYSEGPRNYTHFKDEQVDKKLIEAARTIDDSKRWIIYSITVIPTIWEEAPWLFLYDEVLITGYKEGVIDILVHPTGRLNLQHAWLKKE